MKKIIPISNSRYRLGYHLMAPSGWINDPNGFCYFKGFYHIFYQYHPYSSHWGPMHWGHARSKDLIHWETLPIALTPGDQEDKDGCFSGSAIVKDDILYLIYTGNNYYKEDEHDDYWQNQNLAYSEDGLHFTKYKNNPVIKTPPMDNTREFRDPKVWEYDGHYFMCVGSQNNNGLGRILLYSSDDLKSWKFLGPIAHSKSVNEEGYMWECPDIFRINGKDFLLTSPQGIKEEDHKYLNIHQSGYFKGNLDYEKPIFEHGSFHEIDQGYDFYAPQTMLTPDGRRVMIGWLNMWHSKMPEQDDGWAGALTLPRELVYKDHQIFQCPIKEVKYLREDTLLNERISIFSNHDLIRDQVHLELNLQMNLNDFEGKKFAVCFNDSKEIKLEYDREKNQFILNHFDKPNCRLSILKPCKKVEIHIFMDTSSFEIFLNGGESVMTGRCFFDHPPKISLISDRKATFDCSIYRLSEQANTYNID